MSNRIVRTFNTGRKSSIGTSAVALVSATPATSENGVRIVADPNNTAAVYIGKSSAVTANSADATDGYPLYAGREIVIPKEYANEIYVIAPSGSQAVWWMQA